MTPNSISVPDPEVRELFKHVTPALRDEVRKATEPMTEPVTVDDEQLFNLFAIYVGDVERCALAAGMKREDLQAKVDALGWKEKLKILVDLRTSARPGDSERGVNRAINFVQAHRYRVIVQRLISKLSKMSDDELVDLCIAVDVDKKGNVSRKFSARAFADLASAMEKCHLLSYSSLNDTVGERREREDTPDSDKSTADLHIQISRAMEQVRQEAAAANKEPATKTIPSPAPGFIGDLPV